jgi:hypothetical protein
MQLLRGNIYGLWLWVNINKPEFKRQLACILLLKQRRIPAVKLDYEHRQSLSRCLAGLQQLIPLSA